jgi:hypothetical protein
MNILDQMANDIAEIKAMLVSGKKQQDQPITRIPDRRPISIGRASEITNLKESNHHSVFGN